MWSLGIGSLSKPSSGSVCSKFQNQNRQFCLDLQGVSVVAESKLQNIAKVSSQSENCHDFIPNDDNAGKSSVSRSIQNTANSSNSMCPNNVMVGEPSSTIKKPKRNCSSSTLAICNKRYAKKKRKIPRRKIPNRHSKRRIHDIQEMMDISCDQEAAQIVQNTSTDSESLSLGDAGELSPAQVLDTKEDLLPKNMSCSSDTTEDSFIVFEKGSDQESDCSEDSNSGLLTEIVSCSPSKITCLRRERQYSFAESEDSFIVFDDETDQNLPFNKPKRDRQCSLAESEDSFIVFEDGGNPRLEFDNSDNSVCDSESDYEDYCSPSVAMVIPCKKVSFAPDKDLCEIHPMIKWAYAYHSARKGPWEEYARDRDRFCKRISRTENILAPILDSNHRTNIFKQRYENGIDEVGSSANN